MENTTTSQSQSESRSLEWVALMAGPSHFSPELKNGRQVVGEAILALPFRACVDSLQNAEVIKNRIVIVERGDCTFVQKARAAQKAGALGVIVCDNTPGSSGEFLPMFAMSGDAYNNIEIPVVFLYSKEFNRLLRALLLEPHMRVHIMQMLEFKRLQAVKDSIYNNTANSTKAVFDATSQNTSEVNRIPLQAIDKDASTLHYPAADLNVTEDDHQKDRTLKRPEAPQKGKSKGNDEL